LKHRCFIVSLALLLLISCFPCTVYAAQDDRFDGKTLEEIVNGFLEDNNVSYTNLAFGYYNTVTGESYYFNGDEQIIAASLYKLPLNMYFSELVYKGEMTFETVICGFQYGKIQESSLKYSHNDVSEALQASFGPYEVYRTALLPYLGETEDSVPPEFFRDNTFSPRQMICCLRMLYEEPERFPGVTENLMNAGNYKIFALNETRYDMANKYGFLHYDWADVTYRVNNDAAIVYTEDPFLLVAFSRNLSGTAQTLSSLCTLFCDYTNYSRERRLQKDAADREAAELAAARLTEEEHAAVNQAAEDRILLEQAAAEQAAAEQAAAEQAAADQAAKEEKNDSVPLTTPPESPTPQEEEPAKSFLDYLTGLSTLRLFILGIVIPLLLLVMIFFKKSRPFLLAIILLLIIGVVLSLPGLGIFQFGGLRNPAASALSLSH